VTVVSAVWSNKCRPGPEHHAQIKTAGMRYCVIEGRRHGPSAFDSAPLAEHQPSLGVESLSEDEPKGEPKE